ncbi:MAG: hypothetical protein ABSD48_09990 [Armatimonadota bacterium]
MPARHFERLSPAAIAALTRIVEESSPLDSEGLRDMLQQFVSARMALARRFLSNAVDNAASEQPDFRLIVSRAYYAMYHAARSVVFAFSRADVDAHRELPSKLPSDFPDRGLWVERLKGWRIRRDAADYSPFADEDQNALKADAIADSGAFYQLCSEYVRKRGDL